MSDPSPGSRNAAEAIELKGVRVHNLKGVDVTIPRYGLIAVSGVSGSGKSSLAFDTLYAEGRRRYVECLSTYTRQFLDRADRPDLDRADGLPPAVAVERRVPASQARSTVGSTTEIHDYLRLLFARIGEIHCPDCGATAREDTVPAAVDRLLGRGGRAVVCFEAEIGRKVSERTAALRRLRDAGFFRAWSAAGVIELDALPPGAEAAAIVVDRVDLAEGRRARIADDIETAYRFGHDRCRAYFDDGTSLALSGRLHCPQCGRQLRRPEPKLFSPNSPLGACAACQGFGRIVGIDPGRVVPDAGKTLAERPIDPWNKPAYAGAYDDLRRAGRKIGLQWSVPYRDLPPTHRTLVEEGGEGFYGIRGFFRWLEGRTYRVHVRVFLSRYRAYDPCPTCKGAKLGPEALSVRVGNAHIAEVCAWPVDDALAWLRRLDLPSGPDAAAAPVRAELERRLGFLVEVGVGYLSLDRPSRTLSGGESQRIHLARALGSGLVDTLYVLDEPSVGLHPSDVARVLHVLRKLRDVGNTVVVVEHDLSILEAADRIIDLGPGAGERGGSLVYEGDPHGIGTAVESITGRYLCRKATLPRAEAGAPTGRYGWLEIEGASVHNLQDLTVRMPIRGLTVVTGVSGSGKSSLVHDTLYGAVCTATGGGSVPTGPHRTLRGAEALAGVELVDQAPIGKSPRSNPVTYVGAFDRIRQKLAATSEAKALGLKPGFFSFNVAGGRCESCEGAGARMVEMHFLPDMLVSCDACEGRRFGPRALAIRLGGRNVHDILEMTVDQALEAFGDDRKIRSALTLLSETGLGYLRLGQPAPTLSGGEAQRLKLVSRLIDSGSSRSTLFLLDEPTAGLHMHDLVQLVALLRRLVEAGNTVVCVEHHVELMRAADWIVDLGPGAGPEGGRLVAEGTPGEVAKSEGATGRALANALGQRFRRSSRSRRSRT